MIETTDILQNIAFNGGSFSFNMFTILKVPVILALLVNVFFAAMLFLRVRILADTFKSPKNKMVSKIMSAYVILVLIGTILSLLFVILT